MLIGVDNGVMPIDQMMVTITRPIEESVNSVPGLQQVRSITSRGSAEIDLFFDWNVDMVTTLQLVDAALANIRTTLPPTANIKTHRLTFASFPIIGYSLTSDTVPQTELWTMATYDLKPRLNRLDGVATVLVQGGQEPEFHITPDPAKLLAAGVTVSRHPRSGAAHQPHGLARACWSRTISSSSDWSMRRFTIPGNWVRSWSRHSRRRSGPSGRRGGGRSQREAGLYHRHRQRKAGGSAQRQPPARQQYGRSRE